ncbi:hypothetical protein [Brevundimonas sp. DC300-4]|uniref:hypothetical protein n=1 Tax=Brevundimonas sp. DC300-4 TaxID=2804594 RepID=UPI003CFA70EF
MSIFDHLKKAFGKPGDNRSEFTRNVSDTMTDLARQDEESVARGEVPERRLIPHHAIKRDVIIAAYQKDFEMAVAQVRGLAWTDAAKDQKIAALGPDFEKHIGGVKRLGPGDLDKVISLMKKTRTDLLEIESQVRAKTPIYSIVDPL